MEKKWKMLKVNLIPQYQIICQIVTLIRVDVMKIVLKLIYVYRPI